ncbi:hypothetical protein [Rhodopila sp.]|jgi:hypothetical protein|uniref:hypothetical protein n=1 Tax=Rhodopila sp. TaxID=2480087 RepID=UPI002B816FC9|nr:hypothetical protein [Rhodopila sp.]HVZ09131.1 hypothetical protein [Rhodopila sp.]
MRRILSLGLVLALGGCGFQTWWNPPFTAGRNPNLPVSDSPNMERVLGKYADVKPITSEPGDIWPGQITNAPTMQELEQTGRTEGGPEMPVPGSPLSRGSVPNLQMPNPVPGSSSPPGSTAPSRPMPATPPPLTSHAAPSAPLPSTGPAGTVLPTQGGPSVITGGGPGYQTTVGPGGTQSIVVPNGNGTSTVIHPDGRIETIPTPKSQ